ncbi:ribosome biogenesis GTPase YlqF [Bacillus marinisedimentorum]|uniref:ribosome biogenesis GTPase YlqF n=1 Tax=Bacillus marinisedimentorum TaxID=1821260 RepID=UPI0007E298E1|nr:ribosome biogenesis GTPase YlqF [Bacillus marinisedimentorum]
MTIQWFPGHMAKAKRQAMEKIKLIDVVIELVDARLPMSSRNPMIDEIAGDKPRLVILNKSDLADPRATTEWIQYFKGQGFAALAVNSQTGSGVKNIIEQSRLLVKEKFEKMQAKGIRNPRAVRALILGIPNVGKSTLINRLANKKAAKTGDRPGVTTAQQWIKVGKEFELLDTPGILWPKFEDETVGSRLAVTGAIKDPLLDFGELSVFLLRFLKGEYPELLKERYSLEELPDDVIELFDAIAAKRGFLMGGGIPDYDRTSEMLLRELRSGKIGRITFERP